MGSYQQPSSPAAQRLDSSAAVVVAPTHRMHSKWNKCLQDSWMVPNPLPLPLPPAPPLLLPPAPLVPPSGPPPSCSSPEQMPQLRTETASLRPAPRERAMRSDATSAESRVRIP